MIQLCFFILNSCYNLICKCLTHMISVPGTIQLHRKGVGTDLPKYIFVHKSSDDVFTNHILFPKKYWSECQNTYLLLQYSFSYNWSSILRNFQRVRTNISAIIFAFWPSSFFQENRKESWQVNISSVLHASLHLYKAARQGVLQEFFFAQPHLDQEALICESMRRQFLFKRQKFLDT